MNQAIDPNTWYFTLSALAQVLAAILGLTGVFVAFKLEHVVKQIDYYKRRGVTILKQTGGNGMEKVPFRAGVIVARLEELLGRVEGDTEMIERIIKAMKRYEFVPTTSPEHAIQFLDDTIFFIRHGIQHKSEIIALMVTPVILVLLSMIGAIIFLGVGYVTLGTVYELSVFWAILLLGIVGVLAIMGASYRILRSTE